MLAVSLTVTLSIPANKCYWYKPAFDGIWLAIETGPKHDIDLLSPRCAAFPENQTMTVSRVSRFKFYIGDFTIVANFLPVFSISLKTFQLSQAFEWCILFLQLLLENYWSTSKIKFFIICHYLSSGQTYWPANALWQITVPISLIY